MNKAEEMEEDDSLCKLVGIDLDTKLKQLLNNKDPYYNQDFENVSNYYMQLNNN